LSDATIIYYNAAYVYKKKYLANYRTHIETCYGFFSLVLLSLIGENQQLHHTCRDFFGNGTASSYKGVPTFCR
jgi:hypothetical protein